MYVDFIVTTPLCICFNSVHTQANLAEKEAEKTMAVTNQEEDKMKVLIYIQSALLTGWPYSSYITFGTTENTTTASCSSQEI